MSDTGVVVTPQALRLAGVYVLGIASYLLVTMLLALRAKTEVVIANRLKRWARVATLLQLVAFLVQLHYEINEGGVVRTVQWAHFGPAMPVIGWALTLGGLFLVDHPAIRWIVMAGQAFLIIADSIANAVLDVTLRCRADGSCFTTKGWAMRDMQVVQARQYASIVLGIWLLLLAAHVAVILGCCHFRYSPRIFADTPLPHVPNFVFKRRFYDGYEAVSDVSAVGAGAAAVRVQAELQRMRQLDDPSHDPADVPAAESSFEGEGGGRGGRGGGRRAGAAERGDGEGGGRGALRRRRESAPSAASSKSVRWGDTPSSAAFSRRFEAPLSTSAGRGNAGRSGAARQFNF